jgi:acyl-CoA thioester hydrolase
VSRHLYLCPLRWADMDQLGHVNNVTYVDYLQEARVDMLRVHPPTSGGEALAEGVVVVRHEVVYRSPLVFRLAPVSIELWVTEVRAATFTMAYEVFDETPEGRRVYLRARSVLSPYVFAGEHPRRITEQERAVLSQFLEPDPAPLRPTVRLEQAGGAPYVHSCPVRFSDVDAYRHVNNVKYFEYFQEARIAMMATMAGGHGHEDLDRAVAMPMSVVVAQVDVDYRTPLFFREEPYAVECWVGDVGRTSFVVCAEIHDGDKVLSRSRAVMVAFDPSTGRARPLAGHEKAMLAN